MSRYRGLDRQGKWHYGFYIGGWMYNQDKQLEETAYIQKDIHSERVQVYPETVEQLENEHCETCKQYKAAFEAITRLTSNSAAYTTAAKAYQIARKAMEAEK